MYNNILHIICVISNRSLLVLDMLPSADVLSSAVAFLVNAREWEYLQGVTSINNGYVQVSRGGGNIIAVTT